MAEQTFRSPGFFEIERDLSARQEGPAGVPAGVIGTSPRGPAFVPVTLGSSPDFETRFGGLDPKHPATYAIDKFLANRTSVSFMRVLGAGANDTTDDIEKTRLTGQVKNAGFIVTGTVGTDDRHLGPVQFLVAKHEVQTEEVSGMPIFTDNDSFTATSATDDAYVVRAVIFNTSGSRILVADGDEELTGSQLATPVIDDVASLNSSNKFKLIVSSTLKATIFTASLDPGSSDYIAKILNTNPDRFAELNHLLYLDYSVDAEVAAVSTDAGSIAILSGTSNTSDSSGDTAMLFRDAYGHFDTRFQAAKTTKFISQPFGKTEYDLFYFEALDDGNYANNRIKVSIANLRASTDPTNPFGTFEVQIRKWEDTDQDPQIVARFPDCNLDPRSENYVARKIGDRKVRYIFDADSEDERRIVDEGRYENKSNVVRIVMEEAVERRLIPARALPFGFRGIEALKTNDLNTDGDPTSVNIRLGGSGSVGQLSGSIVPPLPYRFKVTRGSVSEAGFAGNPGVSEEVDGRLYWGAKLERNKVPLNSNTTKEKSGLGKSYSKFVGLSKLDTLVTGSNVDSFNENKFTLARVAFSNSNVANLSGTAEDHIREAAYLRNAEPDATSYKVSDGVITDRITMATLVNLTSSADFNRFQTFNKFTNIMYGGFDGVNILDKNASRLNDRASSSDTDGGASSAYLATGLAVNPAGAGKENNAIFSYQTAAKIFLDPFTLSANGAQIPSINILAIPGIRDSFVTDFVATKTREFSMALYVMDIPSYDDQGVRLFDDSDSKPDVRKTAENFESRAVDNSYAATYFPDVVIDDVVNNRKVQLPASIAALSALGFNDRVGFPWFAPAGFNRGALDFVTNIAVRLTTGDRDTLYDARINPIANFPNEGFVIFGQKNLQQAKSALDRVNIRRLLLEVKRIVTNIGKNIVFEQNTITTRLRFINQVVPQLSLIQAQQGIERFDVIMDERNNSDKDAEQNRLNGRIVIVPTRTIEFVAIDFVITNAGVSFDV
jgi:hypothetical protein